MYNAMIPHSHFMVTSSSTVDLTFMLWLCVNWIPCLKRPKFFIISQVKLVTLCYMILKDTISYWFPLFNLLKGCNQPGLHRWHIALIVVGALTVVPGIAIIITGIAVSYCRKGVWVVSVSQVCMITVLTRHFFVYPCDLIKVFMCYTVFKINKI